jgi:hypothetical protein
MTRQMPQTKDRAWPVEFKVLITNQTTAFLGFVEQFFDNFFGLRLVAADQVV